MFKDFFKKYKKKNLAVLLLMLIILALVIFMASTAYAKYVSSVKGNATAEIAKIICTMDVKSSSELNSPDKTIVNPYYIITLKDFNGSNESQPDEVTQADVNYTVSVTPKKDESGVDTFTLPTYCWYEISSPDAEHGTKIATSTPLTSLIASDGTFKGNVAETRYYKIVFLNSGEQDITRYVDFELKAIQDKAE